MPLSKFLLRNEYTLVDPELYKAADKNDPEALLEGVAMAGLVGVLRQLGDLAEFAAGIFNDLHEEVMATASRGHELKIRVEQIEAEFPSLEKAFFSQTDHSLFLYNEGTVWHPNLRTDQNLIACGVLPRSVMDYYEECRGPPRLFLLDKFDTCGAGASLKRYSDPSFFKAQFTAYESTNAESQMERKPHKTMKKRSNSANRGKPDRFPISSVKLHQLFSEESSQTGINLPLNRVKLKKRQFNGFLFDTVSGRSYMERFRETHSTKLENVCEVYESSTCVNTKHDDFSESSYEVDACIQSPINSLAVKDSDSVPSPNREEKILEICMDDTKKTSLGELPVQIPDIELEKVPTNFYRLEGEKKEMVIGESKTVGKDDGLRLDDVTSDNYMDALTTMESEFETDTEGKPKNDQGIFHIEKKMIGSKSNEDLQELQIHFSDSHSVGNSSVSDEGTSPFRKERSSFSFFYSPSSSAEDVLRDGDVAVKLNQSTEFVDISGKSEHPTSYGNNLEVSEFENHGSTFVDVSRDSSLTDSTFTLSHTSDRESTKAGSLGLYPNSVEDSNYSSDYLPCSINVSDFPSQSRNDLSPMVSVKSHPTYLSDMELYVESSDSFLHLPNFLNLTVGQKNNDDAPEENFPEKYDENSSSHGDLINERLDDSLSFGLHSDVHDLKEQDPETDLRVISLSQCSPGSLNGIHRSDVRAADKTAEEPKDRKLANEVPQFCNSDSEQFELERPKSSHFPCSDAQMEAIDLGQVPVSDSKTSLSNPGSFDQPATNFVHDPMLLQDQSHLHLSDATRVVSLMEEGEKESELGQSQTDISARAKDSPSRFTHSPIEPGVPIGEALESPVDLHNVGSEHSVGEYTKFNPESDELQLPNAKNFSDDCADDSSGSLLLENLRRVPESQFSEILSGHKVQNSEALSSALPRISSFDLLPGIPHQQLSEQQTLMPLIDNPLFDIEDNQMEIPPLPPLPPLEWRKEKLQHGLLSPEAKMVQSSLNPFSPVTTGEQAQLSSPELEKPLNPFLVMDNEKLVNSSAISEFAEYSQKPFLSLDMKNEMPPLNSDGSLMHPDSNECHSPSSEDTNAQYSSPYLEEKEVTKTSNLSQLIEDRKVENSLDSNELTSLPTNEGVNSQDCSLDLDGEMLQSLNPLELIHNGEVEKSRNEFLLSSGNEDVDDHSSLNLEDKVADHMNLLLPIQHTERPEDTSLTIEEESMRPSYQFKPPSTIGDEKPQHVSLSLEEGMKWEPNLYMTLMPPFEEEKPKGSFKAWLHRPRDPLIQAVASHDKSTMRKVSELAQPQVEPKVDERNSLLEQIREKSFNLKPTVMTRPSTQAPKSNLRVSAIIEKANAIRQALAGSDEDDDSESWSDS